jgi:hypothetical protein
MDRRFLTIVLCVVGLVGGVTQVMADPVPEPSSRLLVPYFEVALDGSVSTTFSVMNAEGAERTVRVKLYSNQGIVVLSQNITLGGHATHSITLSQWLLLGRLSGEEYVCTTPGVTDCLELLHLQEALSGRQSGLDGLYYGTPVPSGGIVGFVTIQDLTYTNDNVLMGEWFIVDDEGNLAQGDRLVRYDNFGEECSDLCSRRAFHRLQGGGFDGGTEMIVFNWDGMEHQPSVSPFDGDSTDGGLLGYTYDDVGNRLYDSDIALDTIPTQRVSIADFNISKPFGKVDITTSNESSIFLNYDALGKYSVMLSGWCPECDVCNQLSLCYNPNDPSCEPPPCVPWYMNVSGSLFCEVGGGLCDVTVCAHGTGQSRPTVTGLAGTGLVNQNIGSRCVQVFGYPTGSGEVNFTGMGSCGTDEEVLVITDQAPAYLTLVKTVINDDGGTAVVSDFDLFIDGNPAISGQTYTLAPGVYTASENSLPGYTAGAWGGDCTPSGPNGSVTIQSGDHKVCTITNDDDPLSCVSPSITNIDGSTHFTVGTFGSVAVTFSGTQPLSITTTPLSPGLSKEVGEASITISGTATSATPDGATTTATNDCGSVSFDITVSDLPPDPPVCSFFTGNGQMQISVPYDSSLTLAWGSTNADSAYIGSIPLPDVGAVPVNGTLTINNLTFSRDLKLHLENNSGLVDDTCKLDVNVQPPPPPVCLSFTATPSTITEGESTTLSYNASGGVSASISPNIGSVSLPNGSVQDNPTSDTTYTFSVVGAGGGMDTCQASVEVNPPPPACDDCQGKVSELALRFIGEDGAQVKIKGKYGSNYITLFDQQVVAGGVFTVLPTGQSVPSGYQGTLGNELKVYVDGDYHTTIHTSCSQPIGPGFVSGAFLVVSGRSKLGGELCVLCQSLPSWSVMNGQVVANDEPHNGSHHTEVSYDWAVSGFSGSVQIFWVNGGDTFIKKEKTFTRSCGQSTTSELFWESSNRDHHPQHGAHYFARVLAGDVVVHSEELPVTYD